ncbi:MAG: acyltransferase [Myxococcales bacterium]|nr:acyltransferase [Myxococcales bacterium]
MLLPAGIAFHAGCKKEEPPPPLPSAAPASTPSAPLVLEVEDAGDDGDAADADADAKKGTYVPSASLKACCNALAQNAASAPPPTNMYMMQAAAACNAAVAQGKTSVAGIVSGALKGASMPAACR